VHFRVASGAEKDVGEVRATPHPNPPPQGGRERIGRLAPPAQTGGSQGFAWDEPDGIRPRTQKRPPPRLLARACAARRPRTPRLLPMAGRRLRLRRRLHGTARRQHRPARAARAQAGFPRAGQSGRLGLDRLSACRHRHAADRWPAVRHFWPQAPLLLRLSGLCRRLGAVRAGAEPGPLDRRAGAAGARSDLDDGQQRRDHRRDRRSGPARPGARGAIGGPGGGP